MQMHKKLLMLVKRVVNRQRMMRAAAVSRRRLERAKCAVCFAGLNRSGRLVENCLRTLRHQNLPESCIDITICDIGSPRAVTDELEALARMHRARLIRLNVPNPEWRKPWVMNIAMRHSAPDAAFLLASDLDVIYAPDFIEWVLRCHLAGPRRTFVICENYDLPDASVMERYDAVGDYDKIVACGARIRGAGIGTCQSLPRKWINDIHGYDERLRGWGSEDDDMQKRAVMDRLWHADISMKTSLTHQWHETTLQRMSREGQKRKFDEDCRWNAEILKDASLVRNPGGWGVLPSTAVIMEPSAKAEAGQAVG